MRQRRITPKSILREHLERMHRGPFAERLTYEALQKEHGRQHHRSWPSHDHEGLNLGPDARPAGWRTGEGVVIRRRLTLL